MKILFLSASCDSEEEKYLLSKSNCGLQNSIILFQRNLFNGIYALNYSNCDTINFYPIGSFPNYYKNIFIRGGKRLSNEKTIHNIGFINLPIIKQIIQNISVEKAVKKWVKQQKNEELYIIMYDLLYPHLHAIKKIKMKGYKVKTFTIIADLPNEFGYEKNEKGLKKIIKKYLGRKQLQYLNYIDYFGLLTEQMSKPLNLTKDRYVVIEGFYSKNRYYTEAKDLEKKIILYTGAIYKIYGIEKLLNAFYSINNEDFELWFCGHGDCIQEILQGSCIDKRIKYFGYKNSEEIAIFQSQATVLINPRPNDGEYTKYSFPSKIIEYLSAGRPVIAYKLDGVPEEYYNYIFTPSDDSVQALSNIIIKVCNISLDERKMIGRKGRDFIIAKTSPENQCKKIINLLMS